MPSSVLERNVADGIGLRRLRFSHVPEGYAIPGQFVTCGVGEGKPAFFAIASSPGQPVELLVKQQGEMAERLCALPVGAVADMSDAMGKGFELAPTAGRELVVLVNGSGISAARPVIEAELAAGLPRPVHVFWGVLSPAHRAFLADLERWSNAGVQVNTVVDPSCDATWDGERGWVQDIAHRRGLVRDDSALVLVGVKPMVEAATALAATTGMPAECVVTNF